mmetsp:Transcript_9561/g.19806  ORF Transcript_9561/g.19806 Transcript_9561/m.19806 type:complete len:201 (-) Transcript_9561:239-841(-)
MSSGSEREVFNSPLLSIVILGVSSSSVWFVNISFKPEVIPVDSFVASGVGCCSSSCCGGSSDTERDLFSSALLLFPLPIDSSAERPSRIESRPLKEGALFLVLLSWLEPFSTNEKIWEGGCPNVNDTGDLLELIILLPIAGLLEIVVLLLGNEKNFKLDLLPSGTMIDVVDLSFLSPPKYRRPCFSWCIACSFPACCSRL